MADINQKHAPWVVDATGGLSMLHIFSYLKSSGDSQTLAVAISILGGCDSAAALIEKCVSANEVHFKLGQISSIDFHRVICGYADTLRRWRKLYLATAVLKYSKTAPKSVNSVEYELALTYKCYRCQSVISNNLSGASDSSSIPGKPESKKSTQKRLLRRNWCQNCQYFGIQCCICNLALRTSGSFCFSCGHGGHSHHISSWFERSPFCPSGCGCRCADSNLSSTSVIGIVPSSSSNSLVQFLENRRPSSQQQLQLASEIETESKIQLSTGDDAADDGDEYYSDDDVDYIAGFDPSYED